MYWSKQVVLKLQSIKLFDSTKRGSKAVSTSSGSGGSGWWQEGSALTRAHPTLLSCSELLCSSTLVLTELSYWFKSHFTLLLCNLQQPAHQNWTPWTPYPLLIVCCTWAQPTLIMIEHFFKLAIRERSQKMETDCDFCHYGGRGISSNIRIF